MTLAVRRADIGSPSGVALTGALAAEVAARYADDEPPEPVHASEVAPGRGAFLIASLDG
ncbi:MAG: hypothetical protein IT299_07575, partial [Dehalococcoidia bacterium]|nr:hypothetical protein [Dehalococcoidia bacterium]